MLKNNLIYLIIIFISFILFNKTYCFSASKSNPDILYTYSSMINGLLNKFANYIMIPYYLLNMTKIKTY